MLRGFLTNRPEKELRATTEEYLRSLNDALTNPRSCNVRLLHPDAQPWLTPVIGSGCATSKEHRFVLCHEARLLMQAVAHGYKDRDVGGEPLADAVYRFTEDLIRDRLRLSGCPCDVADNNDVSEAKDGRRRPLWLRDLFVASTLLARLYWEIKALGNDAPRRSDHDDEAVLVPGSLARGRLQEEFIEPCRDVVTVLQSQASIAARDIVGGANSASVRGTLENLLGVAKAHLSARENEDLHVQLTVVQSLAELAWFCLTWAAKPQVYPGWGDLLLQLSHYDPENRSVGIPLFKSINAAGEFIKQDYERITRLRDEGKVPAASKVYEPVAQLLNEQYALRREVASAGGQLADRPSGFRRQSVAMGTALTQTTTDSEFEEHVAGRNLLQVPPPAVAFVTSFDLELELCLLALEKPFTVALPVYARYRTQRVANTCWIGLRVPGQDERSDHGLSSLVGPRDDKGADPRTGWFVLNQRNLEELDRAGQLGPVVVRLAGCPLIAPPDLHNERSESLLMELIHHLRPSLMELSREESRKVVEDFVGGPVGKSERQWQTQRAKAMEFVRTTLDLLPAVLINEYDAIVQNLGDMPAYPTGEGKGTERFVGYGLPDFLIDAWGGESPTREASGEDEPTRLTRRPGGQQDKQDDKARPWMRFWVLLGVQIQDSAFRYRIASLVSSLPLRQLERGAQRNDGSDPWRRGVAVNKYTTLLEQSLFWWNGFDVVQTDVADLEIELDHYTEHLKRLRRYDPSGLFSPTRQCHVDP